MIKCPICQTMHVPNTLFCRNCGLCLYKDDTLRTDDLDLKEDRLRTSSMPVLKKGTNELVGGSTKNGKSSPASNTTLQTDFSPAIHPDPARITIRLKIGEHNREVEMPLRKGIHIGRVDPNAEIFPEIDLTDDIAPSKDVSRRHARISNKNGEVVIQDLASSNGTFLNGKRLESYLTEPLNNGDVLQLGATQIEVRILAQQDTR